jgi:hypothetical protein
MGAELVRINGNGTVLLGLLAGNGAFFVIFYEF